MTSNRFIPFHDSISTCSGYTNAEGKICDWLIQEPQFLALLSSELLIRQQRPLGFVQF